jgi:hypothetical protein
VWIRVKNFIEYEYEEQRKKKNVIILLPPSTLYTKTPNKNNAAKGINNNQY